MQAPLLAGAKKVWVASETGDGTADTSPPAEPVTYLADILEEAGPDVARRCYWDYGRYSDLWRLWRAPGSDRAPRSGPLTLPVRETFPFHGPHTGKAAKTKGISQF